MATLRSTEINLKNAVYDLYNGDSYKRDAKRWLKRRIAKVQRQIHRKEERAV